MTSSEKSPDEHSEDNLRTENGATASKEGEAEGFEVSIGSAQVEELPEDLRGEELDPDLHLKATSTTKNKANESSDKEITPKRVDLTRSGSDFIPSLSTPILERSTTMNSNISQGGWMESIMKKKEPVSTVSPLDTLEAKEEQGKIKRRKCSEFLKTSVVIEAEKDSNGAHKKVVTETGGPNATNGLGKPSSLSYKEGEEWIVMGEGQTYVVKGVFAFLRNIFGTVLLSFAFEGVRFQRVNNCIYFTAKGRKSTATGYELVDRSYKLEFCDGSTASEIMEKVSGSGE